VIVSLHVATGGIAGRMAPSRASAVALGALTHMLGDRMPHDDLASRRFELGSGVTLLLLLAARYGPLHPVTIGAAAGSAPDLEHVLRLPRPGGRKLFPSHRIIGFHRSGGVSTRTQLLAAGTILGVLLSRPRPTRTAG